MKGGEEGLLPATGTKTFQRRRVCLQKGRVLCEISCLSADLQKARDRVRRKKYFFAGTGPLFLGEQSQDLQPQQVGTGTWKIEGRRCPFGHQHFLIGLKEALAVLLHNSFKDIVNDPPSRTTAHRSGSHSASHITVVRVVSECSQSAGPIPTPHLFRRYSHTPMMG
ncbi:hypothetical protein THAOC_15493 [Thalassiosira oceanica]|uniref:Uncharacterized protein n=1 Tax=Thalassiosira oceanica TaxID=159749 RepID=K0SFP3_THAOC|nr:hypothetical protein THAOC_15493 [Thalassiosira oceanica]|eukprot:EJK63829.1 hypothetical protein THAOC_15493 [Thalassiosira oceanica]